MNTTKIELKEINVTDYETELRIVKLVSKNIEKYNKLYDVVGEYYFGSKLYNALSEKSDIDMVFIINSEEDLYLQDDSDESNIHIISTICYKRLLKEHHIMALECFYQKQANKYYDVQFELDKFQLRKRISAVCNNSWSKARKKLENPEEDDYIALKSLFHSLRIISFGLDMARDNCINFTELNIPTDKGNMNCKELLTQILQEYADGNKWDYFKTKYTPIHNKLSTEFRLYAPKELN